MNYDGIRIPIKKFEETLFEISDCEYRESNINDRHGYHPTKRFG